MNEYYEKLKAWNELKKMLERIPDPCLRKTYHDTFVLKAIEEWGFNPEKPDQRPTQKKIDLTKYLEPWEKELLHRIKVFNEYGIDIKPKEEREREQKEAYLNMFKFVKSGGTLTDLPEDLKHSQHIRDLYFKALKNVYGI